MDFMNKTEGGEMKTATAKMKEIGDKRLSLVITSGDNPITVALRFDVATACSLMFEMIAAYKESMNERHEFEIHGQMMSLEFAQWDAAYRALEQWYDVYVEEVLLPQNPHLQV